MDTTTKQNLIGPGVIAAIFGVLSALGTAGFLSEYGATIYASSKWSLPAIIVVQSIGAFIAVGGGIFVLFGVGPVVFAWAISKGERPDA